MAEAVSCDSEIALDGVILRAKGAVRHILLNEPERRNPMSPGIMAGLTAACDRIEADETARVVVLSGAGSAFSAGGDLPYNDAHLTGEPEDQRVFLTGLYKPFLRLLDLPLPTIAAINGVAVGGGLGVAMLCDIRIAADDAKLITAFSPMGFAPGLGLTYSLECAVGISRAAELLYSGRILTGKEAAGIGLVLETAPREDLLARAFSMAETIAANSPVVNRLVKAALFTPYRGALRARLERDILAQVITSCGADYRERRSAGAKRK